MTSPLPRDVVWTRLVLRPGAQPTRLRSPRRHPTAAVGEATGPNPGGSGQPPTRPLPPGTIESAAHTTPPTHRLSLSWLIDITGTEHAVLGDDLATSVAEHHGTYRALCGRIIHPAALTAIPAHECPRCADALSVSTSRHPGRHRA